MNENESEQQYVLFELESGERELHGGPYPPMKAREVKRAMAGQIDTGADAWEIPDGATGVECVPKSAYGVDQEGSNREQ